MSPIIVRQFPRPCPLPRWPTWLEEQLHQLLERLLRVHCDLDGDIESLPAARRSTRVEIYRRLQRARDFMLSSLERPLRLADIASVACLSAHHFLRLFKQSFVVWSSQLGAEEKHVAEAAELVPERESRVHERGVGEGDS